MIKKYTGSDYKIVHNRREYYDVLIDRTTIWGNPFVMASKDDAARLRCVENYKEWLWSEICSGNTYQLEELIRIKNTSNGSPLILGCWCSPKLCHGDVLASACDWYEKHKLS